MKDKFKNKYFFWGLTAFFVIAASICFYYVIFHISSLKANLAAISEILMPVVFGLGIAYLLTPVLNTIERKILIPFCEKCKIKDSKKRKRMIRWSGIIITAFLFFFLIYSLIAMVLSQIVPSIENIVLNFDNYLSDITIWLNNLFENNSELKDYVLNLINKYSNELEFWLNDTILTKSSELIKTVSLSVISVLSVLWDFIIGFIIAIYVLSSKETFAGQSKKIIYALFQTEKANIILNNLRFTHKTFIGFVGGKIVDSIIIGILCLIGTTILGTPYAALVSLVIGVTNVIPFFGPFLGAIPTAILIFVVDLAHPLNCVYFLIFILILQQFDGNVLGPKILGNSTGISGFWVIFSITFFGGLFGVLGMIIGVPVFAVIYATVKSFVGESLRSKNLPESTKPYLNVGAIIDSQFTEYVQSYKKKSEDKQGNINSACVGNRFYSSIDDMSKDYTKNVKQGEKK